ncbi:hypothetical protein FRC05_005768 [Tulasnella sp. 425]|nr:hypothetical protein FRC05_005768 [Tulasnella sp. 425]
MGPELLLEGEAKYSLGSDVWAWACTAFEVLTGREPFPDAKREEAVVTAIILGRPPGSVDLLDSLVSDDPITFHIILGSLKSTIPDCWVRDLAKRPSSSEILNRLVFSDGPGALDIATTSSQLSATGDRQSELLAPPSTDSPMYGNVRQKLKGSPGLEGRLEKRARGEDAAVETGSVQMKKGYGEGAILLNDDEPAVTLCLLAVMWNPLKPNVLATGSVNGYIKLWNVAVAGAPSVFGPVALEDQPRAIGGCVITAIDWDCTGARLVAGSIDGALRVWTADGGTLQLQSNLEFYKGEIRCSMWSPSAHFLLSTDDKGTAVVWDMRTRESHKIYQVIRDAKGFDALWLDDETWVSCGASKQIHVWRLCNETPLQTFTGHEGRVASLRLSKDKTLLASSSYDLTIRIWKMDAVEAGAPVQLSTGDPDPAQKWVLSGHADTVRSLGWCPSPDSVMQYLLVS